MTIDNLLKKYIVIMLMTQHNNHRDINYENDELDFMEKNKYKMDAYCIYGNYGINFLEKCKINIPTPYDYQKNVIKSIIYNFINGLKNNIYLLYGDAGSGKTQTAKILACKLKFVYKQNVNIILNGDIDKLINFKISNNDDNICNIFVINEFDYIYENICNYEKNNNTNKITTNLFNFLDLINLKKKKNLIIFLTSEKSPENYNKYRINELIKRIGTFYKFYKEDNKNLFDFSGNKKFNAIEVKK